MINKIRLFTGLAVTMVAGSSTLAASAQAYQTNTVGLTCLLRDSDGFQGCWGDQQSPSQAHNWPVDTSHCTGYTVRYDGATPAVGHGVPRVNAIAVQMVRYAGSANGGYTAVNGWAGLGQTINTPTYYDQGGDAALGIYMGQQNAYAHVYVTASGPDSRCRIVVV